MQTSNHHLNYRFTVCRQGHRTYSTKNQNNAYAIGAEQCQRCIEERTKPASRIAYVEGCKGPRVFDQRRAERELNKPKANEPASL